MPARSPTPYIVGLFASTIFVSAFLLFQVQPLMGKYILPWFGGSPGVWTTCMLVFQVLLFAGYAYAHLLNRYLSVRQQATLHCSLLALAAVLMPIAPEASWKPVGDESPARLIMVLLLCKVGLPYFLLSSTGPLLQAWISRARLPVEPYRLYALSNTGSLLALLTYPFLFERVWSSGEQALVWSIAFTGFAVLCGTVSWFVERRAAAQAVDSSTGTTGGTAVAREQRNAALGLDAKREAKLEWPTLAAWFALAMLPSVMLLATTNQACLDTAVIPFLWIVPLAIYLLSFILTFDSQRWYLRRPYIMLATLMYTAILLVKMHGQGASLTLELGLYFGSLFCSCMVCHGELVRLKPTLRHLTLFYLTISAGGACGGLFVGLLAPRLFTGYHELQLGLLGCVLVFLHVYLEKNRFWNAHMPAPRRVALAVAVLGGFLGWQALRDGLGGQQLESRRNFYGVLSVREQRDVTTGQPVRQLVHGRVVHGSQFKAVELARQATTYYAPTSGIGRVLERFKYGEPRRIGVVGLGTGTLAVYGREQDEMRFYEINPDVIQLARDYFTFMADSAARITTVLGDARLTLEREKPQGFDVLVLDAFSGDAVPVHLLTREAMQIYDRHIAAEGVLAIHVSNQYFDLASVVAGLAEAGGYASSVVANRDADTAGALASNWVLLARDAATLQLLTEQPSLVRPGRPIIWTDDRSNLFEVLR
jgi:hypothetical protein